MRRSCLLGVVVLLALAGASVAAAPEPLLLDGPLRLSGTVRIEGADASAFCGDTANLSGLAFEAAEAHVHLVSARYAEAQGPTGTILYRLDVEESSYPLRAVVGALSGTRHAGWLGMDAARSGSTAADAELAAHAAGILGNARTDADEDDPAYGRTFASGFVDAQRVETLDAEGVVVLKLSGPDLRLVAKENATLLATGWERAEGAAASALSVQTWATLRLSGATLDMDARGACALAAPQLAASWSGAARYRSAGQPDGLLEGAHRATLRPDTGALRVQFETIAPVPAAPPQLAGVSASWWLGALLFGTTLVGGALYAHRRHRVHTIEQYVQLAEHAAEAGDHAQALSWIRNARRSAPTSLRLRLEEAGLLEATGETEAAIRAYEDCEREDATGEASFLLGTLLRRVGRDQEAAGALARAVEASAWFALDIEADPVLRTLVAEPPLARAMQRARERRP